MAEIFGILVGLFILLYPPYLIIRRIIDRIKEKQAVEECYQQQEEYYDNIRAIREMLEKQEQQKVDKDE